MATTVTITEQELLDALATATAGNAPGDARTIVEIAATTRVPVKRVREALRLFQAQGRLTVHQVTRPALDGRLSKVPAYTIKPAGKKK